MSKQLTKSRIINCAAYKGTIARECLTQALTPNNCLIIIISRLSRKLTILLLFIELNSAFRISANHRRPLPAP